MKTLRLLKFCLGFGVLAWAGAGCRQNLKGEVGKSPFPVLPPPSDVSPKVVAASGDLGGRVMKALQAAPQLRDAAIVVEVSNLTRYVVLTGRVQRAGQVKLATQIARKAAGGVKVVNRITVAAP